MFKGSDEIGTGLIAFCWALFPFSLVIVSLRIWTRVGYLKDRMQIHDWLMLGALVCLTSSLYTTMVAGWKV